MEKNKDTVKTEPYIETAYPKRHFLISDFAFYLFVLFSAVALIFTVSYVFFIFGIEGLAPQLTLFVLLLLYGWWIYKRQLIQYRYIVGESLFTVERTVGKKSRMEFSVHLTDIRWILPREAAKEKALKINDRFFCGALRDTVAICYRVGAQERVVLVSLSDAGIEEVKQRIKCARK